MIGTDGRVVYHGGKRHSSGDACEAAAFASSLLLEQAKGNGTILEQLQESQKQQQQVIARNSTVSLTDSNGKTAVTDF